MIVLGIESSCDDTSVALVKASDAGFVVLSEKTASQIDVHKKYGGVVPEIAGRKHAENILPVVEEVIKGQEKPDVIATTSGPGLITGLLVGVEVAKNLSYLWDVPLVGVNHIAGHVHSVSVGSAQIANNKLKFPALCLVVSGGHTELLLMQDPTTFELIGKTRDDAAGECFDKVAKLIGLDYPGGPKISMLAKDGNPEAIKFPRPMMSDDNFDFSFSGLKTAALYWLQENNKKHIKTYNLKPKTLNDFCASFEQAIVDVLVTKTINAARKHNPKTIILGGGVSANTKLKETLKEKIEPLNCELRTPNQKYSMDNAAMIAAAGYHEAKNNNFTSWRNIQVDPNWKVYS